MSFLDDLKGSDGSGNDALNRAGNTAANTAKGVASGTLSNYLASESNPAKRAAAILAEQGASSLINKIAGTGTQKSPNPYHGMTEAGVILGEQNYLTTPDHSYNTYFSRTTAGNETYNNAHPMYSSLFLVDFKFNHNVVAGGGSDMLRKMMGVTFPMSMSFLLKSMTFPRLAFETVKINRYNKMETRPRRTVYDPVTLTFNDIYTSYNSTDARRTSLMTFMREYAGYYSNDVVKSKYGLQNGLSSDRTHFNFLSSVDIYFFWNSGAKKISMVNPFIESFAYGDLNYEADALMNLTASMQYEYLDISDIDITIDKFMELASHLVEDLDYGHTPVASTQTVDSMLDRAALQPIQTVGDTQRRIGLDNPVAAMAIRLAETAALKEFGADLTSSDPVRRAIAQGAFSLANDAAATTTNATSNSVSGIVKGLF